MNMDFGLIGIESICQGILDQITTLIPKLNVILNSLKTS